MVMNCSSLAGMWKATCTSLIKIGVLENGSRIPNWFEGCTLPEESKAQKMKLSREKEMQTKERANLD